MFAEMRQNWRRVWARPTYAIGVIGVLGAVIGIATMAFTIVDVTLWHPLRVPRIDELVVIRDDVPGLRRFGAPMSAGEVRDLTERADGMRAIGAYATSERSLETGEQPVRVNVAATRGALFRALGVEPQLGRFYEEQDGDVGDRGVVVLSDEFWSARYGRDSRVIGTTLDIDGRRYRTVAVARPGTLLPRDASLWIPRQSIAVEGEDNDRGNLIYTTVARRAPSVSTSQLQKRLLDRQREWDERYGAEWYPVSYDRHPSVIDLREFLAGRARVWLLLGLLAALALFGIATINLASLQLVRSLSKMREYAVRAALGASRWQLVRPLAGEAGILAILGAGCGVFIAAIGLRLFQQIAWISQIASRNLAFDARVLCAVVALTVFVTGLFSVVPIWNALGARPMETIRSVASSAVPGGRQGVQVLRTVAFVQTMLAVVCVGISGVITSRVLALSQVNPGFSSDGVQTAEMALPAGRALSAEERVTLHRRLLEALQARLPDASVATAFGLPFTSLGTSSRVRIVGSAAEEAKADIGATIAFVGGKYFDVLRIPLRSGRSFDATDDAGGRRVAVVDERFVAEYLPGVSPIGRLVEIGRPIEIVGVVGNVTRSALDETPAPAVYLPYPQAAGAMQVMTIAVRSRRGNTATSGVIRAAIEEVEPASAVFAEAGLDELVRRSFAPMRAVGVMLTIVGAMSIIVAIVGNYGVRAFTLNIRQRECGIRIALGLAPHQLRVVIVREGAKVAVLAIILGTLVSLATARALQPSVQHSVRHAALSVSISAFILATAVAAAEWFATRGVERIAVADLVRSD